MFSEGKWWILLVILAWMVCPLVGNAQEQRVTVTSEESVVTLTLGEREVQLTLISLEGDLAEISITMVDMGDFLGIESHDPLGRYLPNVHIMPKTDARIQTAILLQVPIGDGWYFRQIGTVNLASFLLEPIAETTLDRLHRALTAHFGETGGVNLLMPAGPVSNPGTPIALYSTHLPLTGVVIPSASIDIDAPIPEVVNVENVLVFSTLDLSESPYMRIGEAAQTFAPDVVGVSASNTPGSLNDALLLKTASTPIGFRYAIRPVTCADQFGVVVNQTPEVGTTINVFEDVIQLEVCAGTPATVRTTGRPLNLRSVPGLARANILSSIPNGTSLTALTRSTDSTWLRVQLRDGQEGWISADLVELDVPVGSLPVEDTPIINFIADSRGLASGECTTLSWHVLNVSQVTYQGRAVDPSGSVRECLTATTTYMLSVTATDGRVIAVPLTVEVANGGD